MIELYLTDLTPEKQEEILAALGDNGNYDVYPIAIIPTPEDEENEGGACYEKCSSERTPTSNAEKPLPYWVPDRTHLHE